MPQIGKWPQARRLGVDDIEQQIAAVAAEVDALQAWVGTASYDINVTASVSITFPPDAALIRLFAVGVGPFGPPRASSTGWTRGRTVIVHLAAANVILDHLAAAGTGAQFVLDNAAALQGPACYPFVWDGTYWRQAAAKNTGA